MTIKLFYLLRLFQWVCLLYNQRTASCDSDPDSWWTVPQEREDNSEVWEGNKTQGKDLNIESYFNLVTARKRR